jgi:hypothetical protein
MGFLLISPPPLDSPIEKNGQASVPYRRYHTNVNQAIEATIKPTAFVRNGQKTTGGVLEVPIYDTTAEVDSLENVQDGAIVYNEEIHDFLFRRNNTWETK